MSPKVWCAVVKLHTLDRKSEIHKIQTLDTESPTCTKCILWIEKQTVKFCWIPCKILFLCHFSPVNTQNLFLSCSSHFTNVLRFFLFISWEACNFRKLLCFVANDWWLEMTWKWKMVFHFLKMQKIFRKFSGKFSENAGKFSRKRFPENFLIFFWKISWKTFSSTFWKIFWKIFQKISWKFSENSSRVGRCHCCEFKSNRTSLLRTTYCDNDSHKKINLFLVSYKIFQVRYCEKCRILDKFWSKMTQFLRIITISVLHYSQCAVISWLTWFKLSKCDGKCYLLPDHITKNPVILPKYFFHIVTIHAQDTQLIHNTYTTHAPHILYTPHTRS